MTKTKKNTGTREWAEDTVNIQLGCKYNCRYCYARSMQADWLKRTADWSKPIINQKAVDADYGKRKGVVMFPSAHDITPDNISECICVLLKLLDAGNQVLIVSKPHIGCVSLMCERFEQYRGQLEFRFTIGSTSDDVLAFWEPGAPNYVERVDCLRYAYAKGYRTSVSAEPYLDANVEHLYRCLALLITESFWIGTLREFEKRVHKSGISVEQMYDYVGPLLECQSKAAVRRLYEKLDGRPLIKWKDSIREALQIDN